MKWFFRLIIFATKPENFSSNPRTHTIDGSNSPKLSPDLHMCTMPYVHTLSNGKTIELGVCHLLNFVLVRLVV